VLTEFGSRNIQADPALRLREENGAWFLDLNVGWSAVPTGPRVTSKLLGKTLVSRQPFVDPDGSPFQLDHDFHGKAHTGASSAPGPFEGLREGKQTLQLPTNFPVFGANEIPVASSL